MIAHKFKIKSTEQGNVYKTQGYEGYAFTIQAIRYTGNSPATVVYVSDHEGDQCVMPIPGQLSTKVTPIEPVTVLLPLHIKDTGSQNEIVIFGTITKPVLE